MGLSPADDGAKVRRGGAIYPQYSLESNRELHIRQIPLQLIKEACLKHDWTTYEGRRQAVIHHTKYKRKVPIPIHMEKQIVAFPTHSPKDFNCIWIFSNNLLSINNHSEKDKTVITFRNGRILLVNVSPHIIQKQHERALTCLTYQQFSKHKKIPLS